MAISGVRSVPKNTNSVTTLKRSHDTKYCIVLGETYFADRSKRLRPVVNYPPTLVGGQGALFKIRNEPLKSCSNPENGRTQGVPPPLFANRGGGSLRILPHVY